MWLTGLRSDRRLVLYPVENGNVQVLPPLEPADEPILWAAYGRVLYVFQAEALPAKVCGRGRRSGRPGSGSAKGPMTTPASR